MKTYSEWLIFKENDQAFAAALEANPADFNTWLAYADWLEERGDPKGTEIRARIQEFQTLMAGSDPRGVLIRALLQQIHSPGRMRDVNHMGERRLNTYGAWTKAVKTYFPGATVQRHGNREEGYTATAQFGDIGVGEWEGDSGSLYTPQQVLKVIIKHGLR